MQELWPLVPDDSVTIVDKGFLNYSAFYRLHHDDDGQSTNRHWLIRAKSNLKWKTLVVFGPGDELVQVKLSPQSRKLLTSLVDPKAYPAREVAALYHERWEIESVPQAHKEKEVQYELKLCA